MISKYLATKLRVVVSEGGAMDPQYYMAAKYKITVVPDTEGTRPCIECPQCLEIYNYYLYSQTLGAGDDAWLSGVCMGI